MAKRVFIVHGWDGYPEQAWFPWLKRELERKGFEVSVPGMPNTEEPLIENWVAHLSHIVGEADEETFFIGHSIGCQAIMRYLQQLNQKVGGAVFVAGWLRLSNLEDREAEVTAKPWLTEPINFEKVKENINKLAVLLSDNDPYDQVEENTKLFEEKLRAKVLIEHNKGHFGTDISLQVALDEFLNISE